MIILYLGPGIGGGVIAIIIAFLVSLLTFVAAIFWYPIKKLFNIIKSKKK